MKKMNLLRWKFALLLSFCFVGAGYSLPGFDIVASVQSYVSPQEAIAILQQENAELQQELIDLKATGKKEEAFALRLKGKVYSDLAIMIGDMNDVERAFNSYFHGSVLNSKSALRKMTPSQIAVVKSEVDDLLRK